MLSDLVEGGGVGLARLDVRGGLVQVNRAFASLFGYESQRLRSMSLPELAHSEEAGAVSAWLERVGQGGLRRFDEERRFLRADGDVFWARVAAAPMEGGGFLCMAEDVTQIRRESQSAALLSFLVRSTSDAVMSCDRDGIVTSQNQGAERLYGYSSDDVVGQHYVNIMPPHVAEALEGLRLRMLAGESDLPPQEIEVKKKNGGIIQVLANASPIRDADGVIIGFSTIARDISERKRAEAEVRRLNKDLEARVSERTEELERANHDLETFNLALSHDLRSPLMKLEFYAARFEKSCAGVADPGFAGHLEGMRKVVERMRTLIASMQRLSRMTREPLRLEEVDLSALARGILDQLRLEGPDRRVSTVVTPGLSARADPHLLAAALENLLSNAWKFTRRQAEARIEVGAREEGGVRAFFVRDNGAGFEQSQADRLFRPLQRLHTQEEFEGTGLGLTIVARIVQRHGGRVWGEGARDRGATICFTLPDS